jgi:predicted transcriptional regulator
MLKSEALALLGGTVTSTAAAVGVTPSAVSQWPDVLPRRIEDRVLAAVARARAPANATASTVEPKAA